MGFRLTGAHFLRYMIRNGYGSAWNVRISRFRFIGQGNAIMRLKFAFNSAKALEALAYVAHAKPGLTPLYVAKIFFFAEK
jgi:hypothetical protein